VQEAIVVPDDSIAITKIGGLAAALVGKASAEDITTLTRKYDGKQDVIDESVTLSGLFRISGANNTFSIDRLIEESYSPILKLQYNNGLSRMIVLGELRPTSINGLSNLDVLDTLSATRVLASNLYTKVQIDELLNLHVPTIADGSLSIASVDGLQSQLDTSNEIRRAIQGQLAGAAAYGVYTRDDLTALSAVVTKKQDKLDGFSNLDVASIAVRGALMAGPTQINSTTEDASLYVGSNESYLRFKHGHHLDSYTREGVGRDLQFCFHTGNAVRIGNSSGKLAIGCAPSNYQLDLNGAMRASSFVEGTKFNATSDQRLKSNIERASLDECTRLVQTVRPMTFTRNDMNDEPHVGYIAQHWDSELKDGYRNSIMGASEKADGPLLSLDHGRICVILHGALLSALARIEALESRM
jgi:hypothetical protein